MYSVVVANNTGDEMDQRDKDRLLWNLKSLPNEVEDLVKGFDEETMRWRPRPNKWSIKEIVCHLRDMERLAYLARYRRMLAEENQIGRASCRERGWGKGERGE